MNTSPLVRTEILESQIRQLRYFNPPPTGLLLSSEDMKEISKGNVTEDHFSLMVDPDCHLMGFWHNFESWNQLASQLAEYLRDDMQRNERLFSTDLSDFKGLLEIAFEEIFSLWPEALFSEREFGSYSVAPKLRLIESYICFTNCVRYTAAQMYPAADLQWLDNYA